MKNPAFILFCCLQFLTCPTLIVEAKAEPIVVIVNKSNPTDNIQSKKLSRIYRGRLNKWPDGKKILVINRPFYVEIRAKFYKIILKAEQTKRFFKPGTPIPFKMMNLKSDLATLKFVAHIPSAIGYIYLSAVDDTVKVLSIDSIAPGQKGYRLN